MILYTFEELASLKGSAKKFVERGPMKPLGAQSEFSWEDNPQLVVNLGNSRTPRWYNPHMPMLNQPHNVREAVDKIRSFKKMNSLIEWTLDKATASKWQKLGHSICARKVVNGRRSEGLVISKPTDPTPLAKLYTRFIAGDEFRAYITISRGMKYEVVNFAKRKEENSTRFTYERTDIQFADSYRCANAMVNLNLFFGAVDFIVGKDGQSYVLEVNSDPGILKEEYGLCDFFLNCFKSWA